MQHYDELLKGQKQTHLPLSVDFEKKTLVPDANEFTCTIWYQTKPATPNLPCFGFGRDARMHGDYHIWKCFFFNGNRETSISLIETVGSMTRNETRTPQSTELFDMRDNFSG